MNDLVKRLGALDKRLIYLIVAAIYFVAIFQAWVLLRGPVAELRSIAATETQLQAAAAGDRANAVELEKLTRAVEAIEARIAQAGGGGAGAGGDDAMVPLLMTSLDGSAKRHAIQLGAVRPPSRRPIAGFDEIGYGVEARGDYRALFDWIRDASAQADPLVVAGLSMRAIDEGQRIALTLRLAAYRPSFGDQR